MRFFIMAPFARTSKSKKYEIISIEPPFSFFDFIDSRFQELDSLRRLLSQIRQHNGKTMVIEEIEDSGDLIEENEDIAKRIPGFNKSKSFRLSFFLKKFSTPKGIPKDNNDQFIGYIIIKADILPSGQDTTRIYESVINFSRHPNNCIRGSRSWVCDILGNKFEVKGYLYAQQNGITNVCAHVALRTAAASYHKDGDMSYRKMNDMLGIDHVKKKTGDGNGLYSNEMVKILEEAGATCFTGDYSSGVNNPLVPFQKYIYGSIESGYPAIVIFKTTEGSDYHGIPIFGHTFNEDTWVPRAEFSYFKVGEGTQYMPSESWLSMYIAHDDNWGSNYCIPRQYLHANRICNQLGSSTNICPQESEGVAYVISTVPKKVKANPISAEVVGADYLFSILEQMPKVQNQWNERLLYYANENKLVLRPILVSLSEYADHLNQIKDWSGKTIKKNNISALKNNLSGEYYWLIELSVPELFSANRRKIGEVLILADKELGLERDFKSFVIARTPKHFVNYEGGGSSNPRYKFFESGIEGHVELFGAVEE